MSVLDVEGVGVAPEIVAANSRFFNGPEMPLEWTDGPPHILTVRQFSPQALEGLFTHTDELRNLRGVERTRRELAGKYVGHQICSLFYEPSTRTRLSFEQAALALGAGVVSTENAKEFSSAAKGETLVDTVRVLGNFAAIILRHHETGSAALAASKSEVPIINAGDGKGEHPTQALLDTYTIQRYKDRLDNLRIVMGGDLKHGRTVRSLAQMLALYPGNHISFVSTPGLAMEPDIKEVLNEHSTTYDETFSMEDALSDPLRTADVIYWTRTQTERVDEVKDTPRQGKLGRWFAQVLSANHVPAKASDSGSLPGSFVINRTALDVMRPDAIIMHPLPRVWEIAPEVDDDPRAVYFSQAGNGMFVRMALLDLILAKA